MTAAADDTLEALLSAAAAIWPSPARVSIQDDARPPTPDRPAVAEMLVVPSLRNPKLVLPADAPRVAAGAFSRGSDDGGASRRLTRAVASRALRLPGAAGVLRHPRLMGAHDGRSNRLTVTAPAGASVPSLQRHLSELLGVETLLGFGVGSPRANRKPVVQVFDSGGRTVAWAKLGIDPIGRELVRGEAEALRVFWSAERSPDHLMAPRVLSAGSWGDTELLVLSPLVPGGWRRTGPASSTSVPPNSVSPTSVPSVLGLASERRRRDRPRRRDIPRAAMEELAGRFGIENRPLPETEFWRKIRKVPELTEAATAAEAEYGRRTVALGAWHGDWTPWNMRTDGDRVLLWDFERFALGVPVGLDVAHYRLQSALRSGGERAAERLLIDGPLVDEPGGELLTSVYLLELGRRWVQASEPDAGAPLRARTGWLLRLLGSWFGQGPAAR